MPWLEAIGMLAKELGLPAVVGAVVAMIVQSRLNRSEAIRGYFEQQRSQVFADSYARLSDLNAALARLASPDYDKSEWTIRVNRVQEAAEAFRGGFQRNRLWFKPQTCSQIDKLWLLIKDAAYALIDAQEYRENMVENRKLARAIIASELPVAMRLIEAEFRQMHGLS